MPYWEFKFKEPHVYGLRLTTFMIVVMAMQLICVLYITPEYKIAQNTTPLAAIPIANDII